MSSNAIAVRDAAPDTSPLVFERAGQVFTSSLAVAQHFDKRHKNVLATIQGLIDAGGEECGLNFQPTSTTVVMPKGGSRTEPGYDMTRDGFVLLAMSFTGAKALRWKMLYISAFNEMERQSRAHTAPPALNDPAALRTLLLGYTEQVIELRAENALLAPKADGFDRIATADGPMCITDTAKALQLAPKALFDYLRQHGWTYRRAGAGHLVGYQNRVAAGLLTHKVTTVTRPDGTEKVVEHVLVTPKGLARLAAILATASPTPTGADVV